MSDEPTAAAVLTAIERRPCPYAVPCEKGTANTIDWCDRCLLASAARLLRQQEKAQDRLRPYMEQRDQSYVTIPKAVLREVLHV
jgi:hypothetical protein